MADAAWTFGDQALTERAVGKPGLDRPSGSARFDLSGRRGLKVDAQVVQTAGAGKSGVDRRMQHAITGEQPLPRIAECQALQKGLRCHTRPAHKQPMKVMGTEPDPLSHFFQRWLVRVVRVETPNDSFNPIVIVHGHIIGITRSLPTRFLLSC